MGAITITGTWHIAASLEDVWEVVTDLETWPRWWPAINDIDLTGAPDRARFTFDTPSALPPLVLGLEVVERHPPERLLANATDGPLAGAATLSLEPLEDHSAVRFAVDLRVRSLLFRPLGTVLGNATRAGGRERLRQAGDDLAVLVGADPLEHEV